MKGAEVTEFSQQFGVSNEFEIERAKLKAERDILKNYPGPQPA